MNIRDIARMAEVSVSTVSKIINNKDQDISEETRKKVLKLVKEYQYVPYAKVINNAQAKSGMIGVMVPKMKKQMMEFIAGAESAAEDHGYHVLLCAVEEDKNHIEKQMRLLCSRHVDGIICYSEEIPDEKIQSVAIQEKIPVVLAGSVTEKTGLPTVYYSRKKAAYKAIQYLLKYNHRSIGLLLDTQKKEGAAESLAGYTQALYEKNISFRNDYIRYASLQETEIRDAVKELLTTGVTAIAAQTGIYALMAAREIEQNLLKIPQDISLVSLEEQDIFEFSNPPIDAILNPFREIGEKSVSVMAEQIENKNSVLERKEISSVIKSRNSCGKPSERIKKKGKGIAVAGSMNMDIIMRLPKDLSNGETVIAKSTSFIPGGKGANQAVGAGRLGGNVYALGCLGGDDDGREIYKGLIESKVHTEGIIFDHTNPTGRAYINVPPDGESSIVVYPGANNELKAAQIDACAEIFDKVKYCLLSTEICTETVAYMIEVCSRKGIQVMIKPSPAEKMPKGLWDKIDYLIPNEKEIHLLKQGKESIEQKAEYFFKLGVKNVLVTLGKKGCYLLNKDTEKYFPAPDVTAVDTTGAADSFISALAVYLSEGNPLIPAIGFATCAAGISITREGVQPALPDRMMMRGYEENNSWKKQTEAGR